MRSERAPLKSWLLAILAIGYVFVAAGCLTLGLNALPNSVASSILYALYPFLGFAVILAPIAIREGRSQKRLGRFALEYVGLMYVGILGQAIIGRSALAFDPPPHLVVTWQVQAVNSFAFAALFGLLNIPATLIIWVFARMSGGYRPPDTWI